MNKSILLVCLFAVAVLADDLSDAAVAAHTIARDKYGLKKISWDIEAAAVAQRWAEQCNFEHNGGRGDHGENLWAGSGDGISADDVKGAIQSWVDEGKNYDCENNQCDGCGHFTQVVWDNSIGVGCGWASCHTNSPFGDSFKDWKIIVCDYSPPGNWVGERPFSADKCNGAQPQPDPTENPTPQPDPTENPAPQPDPTENPAPTNHSRPTGRPTGRPTARPTWIPTERPTNHSRPTWVPTERPTNHSRPTWGHSGSPTGRPTERPPWATGDGGSSGRPTERPTERPPWATGNGGRPTARPPWRTGGGGRVKAV